MKNQNMKRNRKYKKGGANRRVANYRKTAKRQYVPTKVPLLQPITLKPQRMARRVVYNNMIKVVNNLVTSGSTTTVEPQFITLNLNSPWVLSSFTYSGGGSSEWTPNRTMSVHSNGSDATSGTAYPGLFETDSSIGESYREMCVTGCRVTATYTPIENSQDPDTQPTAFFGIIQTGPSNLTNANLTSNAIYDQPYSRVSKVQGFGNGTSGNVNKVSKGGYLQFRYSAKKFNFIKDISDAKSMWASNQSGQANHPGEKDTLVIGIAPLLVGENSKALVSGILQLRMEAFMLFGEPNNQNNFADPVEAA